MSKTEDSGGLTALRAEIERRTRVEEEMTQTLAASDELFRLLVESVRDYAIFMLDPRGNVATWNAGAERFKGYTANEIIGRHFSTFYPPEDVAAGKCEMELEVATREGRFEEEGWRVRKDGSRFWANVVISAARADGVLVGFAKVTRDLTERKRAEELRIAAEVERGARLAAEHASRVKDEFLAMLGHELRNPLAPIVTALDLIAMRETAGPTREYEVIQRQVKHMMHLVDDLLDVSRIASGKVELRKALVDIRDVITKAVELASPVFEQKRHHLAVEVPAAPLRAHADSARLTQVVANLLTNAAKYTAAAGQITIRAVEDGNQIVIDVIDNGAGMGPELLARVFDVFVQGYQTSERSGGGLGLGLALVKSLVTLHGGNVTAFSEGLGKGSRFTVTLLAAGPEPTIGGESREVVAATREKVLVVDDNDDARDLLAELLASVGFDVRAAGDAVEALEVVKTFAPQVAILDIGLPVIDGYDLAVQLRERMGAATPALIAVTGYGQNTDKQRSTMAGFARHLVKPVDLKQLIDAIAEVHAAR